MLQLVGDIKRVMYAEITSALAGLKTVSDLIGLTLKLKVDSAVTEKAIESQAAIISLQKRSS